MSETRRYDVGARSTDVFGRVLVRARDQHLVSDGPVHNGCPGEAITPAELFLGGVAACAVELLQALARDEGLALAGVEATISGEIDPGAPARPDVSVFNRARLALRLAGVNRQEGERLVEGFKRR